MAELPTLKRQAVVQQIRVTDSSANATEAIGRGIANVADTLATAVRPTARAQAAKRGELEATSVPIARDSNGNLIAPNFRDEGLSITDARFNEVLRQRYQDELWLVGQGRVNDIAMANEKSPIDFRETAGAYIAETAENIPDEFKQIYLRDMGSYADQVWRGLEIERRDRETAAAHQTTAIVADKVMNEAIRLTSTTGLASADDQQQLGDLRTSFRERINSLVEDNAKGWSAGRADQAMQQFDEMLAFAYLDNRVTTLARGGTIEQAQASLAQVREAGANAPIDVPGIVGEDGFSLSQEDRDTLFNQVMRRGNQIVEARAQQREIRLSAMRHSIMIDSVRMMEDAIQGRASTDDALEAVSGAMITVLEMEGQDPEAQLLALQTLAQGESRLAGMAKVTNQLEVALQDAQDLFLSMPPTIAAGYMNKHRLTMDMLDLDLSGKTPAQRDVQLARVDAAIKDVNAYLASANKGAIGEARWANQEYLANYDAMVRRITDGEYNAATLPQDDPRRLEITTAMGANYQSPVRMTVEQMEAQDQFMTTESYLADRFQQLLHGKPISSNDWTNLWAMQVQGGDTLYREAIDDMVRSNALMNSANQFMAETAKTLSVSPHSVEPVQMQAAARMASRMRNNPKLWGKIKSGAKVPGELMERLADFGGDPGLTSFQQMTDQQRQLFQTAGREPTSLNADQREELREYAQRHDIDEHITDRVRGNARSMTAAPIATANFHGAVKERALTLIQEQAAAGRDPDMETAVEQAINDVAISQRAVPSHIMWVGQSEADWNGPAFMAANAPGGVWQARHQRSEQDRISGTAFEGAMTGVDLGKILGDGNTYGKLGTDLKLMYQATQDGDVLYSLVTSGGGQLGVTSTATGQPYTAIIRYSQLEDWFINNRVELPPIEPPPKPVGHITTIMGRQ